MLPQTLTTPLGDMFARGPDPNAAKIDPQWTRQMEQGVTRAKLTLTAILDEFEMSLGQVAELRVGSTMSLSSGGDGHVRIECAERGVFLCRLGERGDRYALEIEDIIANRRRTTAYAARLTAAALRNHPEPNGSIMNAMLESDGEDETELNVAVTEAAAAAEASGRAPNLDAILAIPVTVQVVLGTTSMPVAKLMKLNRGAVITLDQRVGAPVSVLVNGRTVARGEVVVVDEDNSRFGVTLTEIVSSPYEDARCALRRANGLRRERTDDNARRSAMTGTQKAATILLTIGKPAATQLMKNLTHSELRAVTMAAAKLGAIQADTIEEIVGGIQRRLLDRRRAARRRDPGAPADRRCGLARAGQGHPQRSRRRPSRHRRLEGDGQSARGAARDVPEERASDHGDLHPLQARSRARRRASWRNCRAKCATRCWCVCWRRRPSGSARSR